MSESRKPEREFGKERPTGPNKLKAEVQALFCIFRTTHWSTTMKHILLTLSAAAIALTVGTAAAAAEPQAPSEAQVKEISASLLEAGGPVFPIGVENVGYAKYFTGQTFLASLTPAGQSLGVSNVTFAPGVINFWHTHQKSCQVLVGVSGRGWYQIWGEEPKEILPGTTATIPENVKHWHGSQHGGWFQHLSIMSTGAGTTWMEPVDPAEYAKLK